MPKVFLTLGRTNKPIDPDVLSEVIRNRKRQRAHLRKHKVSRTHSDGRNHYKSICLGCGKEMWVRRVSWLWIQNYCSHHCQNGEALERFWSRAKPVESGCWEWTGMKLLPPNLPYGRFKYFGKEIRAHRLSWMLSGRQIPKGMIVCHKCDNPKCVNPEHLFVGTYKDNMEDASKKGRMWSPGNTTTCGEIHPKAKLTEEAVRFIRSSSLSSRLLGIKFNVHRSAIKGVRRFKTWKHVK